jgi:PAS domain S-box-containing protein
VILGEYSIDNLLRYAVPTEISAKYAVTLLDSRDNVLAGRAIPARHNSMGLLPWATHVNEDEVPVSPVGNGLILRAQAWRTSLGVVGSGLFWLVCVLSAMTAWMLIANWRHTRRRMHAQNALVAETTFRRAMENSMLTGMRALDMQGRITYVNPAFCQMTGWSEAELVGRTAPFPYWPEEDHEPSARAIAGGTERQDPAGRRAVPGQAQGRLPVRCQAVCLAPDRCVGQAVRLDDVDDRHHRTQPHPGAAVRVLRALHDRAGGAGCLGVGGAAGQRGAAVRQQAVPPVVRHAGHGHLQLVEQAGMPEQRLSDDEPGRCGWPGRPAHRHADRRASPENAEIYVAQLGKWLEVRSRYLNWVDGRLAQMVIATDITPRRMAEELSAAQAERAHSASRLITMGEMASSVAHELNQPLTAINNYCSGMVTRIKEQANLRRGPAGRTGKDVATGPAGGPDHPAHPVFREAQRAQPHTLRRSRHGGRGRGAGRDRVPPAQRAPDVPHRRAPAQLRVDPILIEQVLVNLMKNAAESIDTAARPSARRNVELRVLPKIEEGLRAVEFSVTDTGQGLAPEVMERLFEAFFSTKAEGMGIGLNLCRSIVESHHGRMQARNLYNGQEVVGCCFSFWIPVTDSPQTDAFKDSGVTA